NESEDLSLLSRENGSDNLFPLINKNLHQASQSLNELTQLSIKHNKQFYKKNNSQHIIPLTTRARATTNLSLMQKPLANNPAYPYLYRQKQNLPEPTRINRRVKSSRVIHTSASALSIDNIKQQHRIASASSVPSSRSLSIMRRCLSRNENLNEINSNQKSSRCCSCCFSLLSTCNSYPSKTKPMFNSTPTHSLTNDDDDDEKLSSSDANNRTPMYTSIQSTHLTCRNV
ncbi:unnamed protein product, partial [Rotaria magnacalcarata]